MGLVTLPTTFAAGNTARASEVNDNFLAIVNEVNGNLAAINLANGAVTENKIADGVVSDQKLKTGIDAAKISTGLVTNAAFDHLAGLAENIQLAIDSLELATSALETAVNARALATRTISPGSWLSGGGDLTANRTLTVTPTVTTWLADSQGNSRIWVGSATSPEQFIFRLSRASGTFAVHTSANTPTWEIEGSTGQLQLGVIPWARLSDYPSITASTGLTGGGVLSATRSLGIAAGGVGTTQLADLGVTNGKLANLAVTAGKIATGTIVSSNIMDGNITAAKLATDAVTTAKILNGAVTAPKLGVGLAEEAWVRDLYGSGLQSNAGARGCLAFAHSTGATEITYGTTVLGSTLRPANTGSVTSATALTGSWMCLGHVTAASGGRTTLWLRVA
jgi:trimeric autotransporter adhesin